MAVSRDASGTAFLGSASPLSSSTSITVTAAATCLVVSLATDDANVSFSGVTWGGTSLTRIGTTNTTDLTTKTELWGLVNPASGAQSLSVTWTGGAPTNVVACAVSYKGTQTTFSSCFPSADVVSQVNNSLTSTNSVTVTAPTGDYAFAAGNGNNATTYTINQTSVYADHTTFCSAASDGAGSGSVAFTGTLSGITATNCIIGCHIVAATTAAVAIAIAAELFAPKLGPDWRPRNFQPRPAYNQPTVSTASLSGKTNLAAALRTAISPNAAISAKVATSSWAAVSAPTGKAGLSAKTAAAATAKANISGKAALLAVAKSQARAAGAVAGAGALIARGFAAATTAGGIAGKTALAAKATATSTLRTSYGLAAALIAQATAQARATGGTFSGKAALAARATAALVGRIIQPGAIALMARALAKMVAGAGPSGKTSLSGVLKLQSTATAGSGATTALSAIARAAASSRAGIAAVAKLAATSSAASFVRGGISAAANMTALSAVTRSALSARAAIAGKLQLAARAEAKSFSSGGLFAGAPLIGLAGRTLIRFVARALLSAFEPSPRVADVNYESRVVDVPTESRVVDVPYESRVVDVSTYILAGQAMAVIWPNKDPGEIADFDLNWPPRLGIVDTITSSSWSIVATDSPTGTPIAIQSSSFVPTRTKVWLTGGNLGFTYSLQNTVVTANGDTLVQTAKVLIKKK